jgi:hypothetical protein
MNLLDSLYNLSHASGKHLGENGQTNTNFNQVTYVYTKAVENIMLSFMKKLLAFLQWCQISVIPKLAFDTKQKIVTTFKKVPYLSMAGLLGRNQVQKPSFVTAGSHSKSCITFFSRLLNTVFMLYILCQQQYNNNSSTKMLQEC